MASRPSNNDGHVGIDDDSTSQDFERLSLCSNVAEIDENEVDEYTNDEPAEEFFDTDSCTTITERLDVTVFSHEMKLEEAESPIQLHGYLCHLSSFDGEQVEPQPEQQRAPLEQGNSQYPSNTPTIFPWPSRNNLLPCSVCGSHGTVASGTQPDGTVSSEGER